MGTIIALGLAAAVYPQLLATVVVVLTRPQPRPLLWACYLGALGVNVACGVAILAVFRSRGTVFGSTSQRLGAATYFILGALALAIAGLVASRRGRGLFGGDRLAPRKGEPDEPARSLTRIRGRAEEALRGGSVPIAVCVGAILGIPGPFDLVAAGHLARAGYAPIALVGLLAAFFILKFLLIELPIASYAINPAGTAARADRFSAWMKANKIEVIAAVVGVISLFLIARGFSRLS